MPTRKRIPHLAQGAAGAPTAGLRAAQSVVEARPTHDQHREAIGRVLRLVDGYLSTLPQDALAAWRGGMMTWGELRQHVKAAIKVTKQCPREGQ